MDKIYLKCSADLEKELNLLFIGSTSANITSEDDKVLTVLNAEIDALYEAKTPSLKAFEILKERESLSNF